ncbi:MAG: DNA repair protein RadC [Candidatus Thiodiazotropha sp.]
MTQPISLTAFSDEEVIDYACSVLEQRLHYRLSSEGAVFTSPIECRKYLTLKMAELEREVFAVLFLDNRHRLIKFDVMFFGTIDGATVHPREVVKAALMHNAAAVILAHNHPSGVPEPSNADKRITQQVKEALKLIDIRVLDHIVVGGTNTLSFAELSLI